MLIFYWKTIAPIPGDSTIRFTGPPRRMANRAHAPGVADRKSRFPTDKALPRLWQVRLALFPDARLSACTSILHLSRFLRQNDPLRFALTKNHSISPKQRSRPEGRP